MNKSDVKEYYQERQKQIKITLRKISLVERIRPYIENKNVTDVGCGDGFITACLAQLSDMVGCDLDVSKCQKMFPEITFKECEEIVVNHGTVLLLDVLEHIPENDEYDFLNWWCGKADQCIINLPVQQDKNQIIDRQVSIPHIIKILDSLGYQLKCATHWCVSEKEQYFFMVLSK